MKKMVINRSLSIDRNKRAQHTVGLPFGLIFSIFLIVIFIIAAFWAVNHFLDIGQCSRVGLFYDGLQNKIDDAWSSQSSEFSFEVDVDGIEKVCFGDLSLEITNPEDYALIERYYLEEANVFLVPPEKACNIPFNNIKHINITEITKERNPYCIDLTQRNEIIIKKGFYDKLVLVE